MRTIWTGSLTQSDGFSRSFANHQCSFFGVPSQGCPCNVWTIRVAKHTRVGAFTLLINVYPLSAAYHEKQTRRLSEFLGQIT
jgi:hypothetical protein